MTQEIDEYMQGAIAQAKQGLAEDGIPIGSVLVRNGEIIAQGHNQRVQAGDPITHAEIDCLRNAGRIGSYKDTILYSTLMPCYLCAGAVVQFGIPTVVVGEASTFTGAQAFMEAHGVQVTNLDLDECKQLMQDFINQSPQLWHEDIGID